MRRSRRLKEAVRVESGGPSQSRTQCKSLTFRWRDNTRRRPASHHQSLIGLVAVRHLEAWTLCYKGLSLPCL